MAALSRILNVLVILAAVGALFIAMKLSGHRQAARDRGDTYATTLQDTAKALDAGSGSAVAAEVTRLDWSDYEGNPSGTKTAAGRVTEAAKAVVGQRDAMAEQFSKIGQAVGVELDDATLKKIDTYKGETAKIDARLAELKARDENIAKEIAAIGGKIGAPTESSALLGLETSEAALKSVTDKMATVHQYYRIHITTLDQIVKAAAPNLEFSEEDLQTANPTKVESLLKNLGELTAAMKENVSLKAENARIKDDNVALTETNNQLRKDLEVALLPKDDIDKPEHRQLVGRIQGEVVNVNYDMNYLVINFSGKTDIPVPSTTLTVARDREFICNAVVTEVFDTYAVADILPDLRKGTVIPGDAALFVQDAK